MFKPGSVAPSPVALAAWRALIPVVTHVEALDCFLRTKMDVLVVGNWFVSR